MVCWWFESTGKGTDHPASGLISRGQEGVGRPALLYHVTLARVPRCTRSIEVPSYEGASVFYTNDKGGIIMIEIMNLRDVKPSEPYDFLVDRRSPAGNPYFMAHESMRDTVCDKYAKLLWETVGYPRSKSKACVEFVAYLEKMRDAFKEHGKLRLFCWCAPKRCHAETIRDWIIRRCQEDSACVN